MDGEDRQFLIDGLMEGEQYVFNAQAQISLVSHHSREILI